MTTNPHQQALDQVASLIETATLHLQSGGSVEDAISMLRQASDLVQTIAVAPMEALRPVKAITGPGAAPATTASASPQAQQGAVVRLPNVHELAAAIFVEAQAVPNPPSPTQAYQQAEAFINERSRRLQPSGR